MVGDTLSLDMVGHKFDPLTISWNAKDVMLYALGVGAKPADELDFVYEGSDRESGGPLVLPTYAVIPATRAMGNLRHVVKLKIQRLLHGEQGIELLRPLPVKTEITLESKVSEVWDKGKSGVIGVSALASDADGPLFKSYSTLFYIGGGGFGGEPGPSTKDKNQPPEREPDLIIDYATQPEQGAIYRLSGDRVALHIDPEFARKAGYDKPFMHGLCTYGFVGRAILHGLCGGDPARFKSMTGRFADTVQFEDHIVTKFWNDGPGAAIIQVEDQNGGVVLSQARATFAD
ncbi:MAG: MaoC/PaaZ C-terminal domain-containing protein [Alphaproteobacteria bacterium]|jgi:acyl dehydratase|nr:3-alpha,7-alpha,12-alpha-trihydroxy-5-beta-cholest-24-enoyl-CoA hydratase [Rhodospirillaceae bacterium]MDP6021096.1 MaoC/PaaZ C-terminal domain-containing protein [Alphaproteobacteria bacterium]MDP6255992.1 MaoC/PaaZ C-terminal domain-containing protein [Alphaproteobacteria bacterium]MDP7054256.1 MaoC/PaaZ C-terminal domain-containing protein [Alphaproteobacteria bacterium]MDP7229950.1 MaoC/PaaZ C-terminal domain-containing protein [Alphaproteobacteria bacterium]|tara:strand:+ start:134 stop:997 length:864 start_codon:yes stop_codon:yes gene_type:complete